ncbi:hypothetical protein PYW08_010327 [Mythimna loreyi]|uniref:Uncharacterized protein n=1 Tax=Mythimna loreyi TaxID=667449 RepID=A0ACC2Q6N5_9NEOP|nr:hypothetical protein PYW08_010327 [Mythimna loreyi]
MLLMTSTRRIRVTLHGGLHYTLHSYGPSLRALTIYAFVDGLLWCLYVSCIAYVRSYFHTNRAATVTRTVDNGTATSQGHVQFGVKYRITGIHTAARYVFNLGVSPTTNVLQPAGCGAVNVRQRSYKTSKLKASL